MSNVTEMQPLNIEADDPSTASVRARDEEHAGLVESLFWIPTKLISTRVPLNLDSLDTARASVVYLNAVLLAPPEQLGVSPPLTCFLVDAAFLQSPAEARKKVTLRRRAVSVFVYAHLRNSPLATARAGDRVLLRGYLRRLAGSAKPDLELHGAEAVVLEDVDEATASFSIDYEVSYASRGNGAPKDLQPVIWSALAMCVPTASQKLLSAIEMSEGAHLLAAINLGLTDIRFSTVEGFFWALHFPDSEEQHEAAKLAARNLGCAEIVRRAIRASFRPECASSVIPLDRARVNALIRSQKLVPTKDQVQAMMDIFRDLASMRAMRRLLSGDVGTGKTLVFGVLAVAARELGKRVVIFIPNGPLAMQVATELRGLSPGASVCLVTSSQKPSAEELQGNPILIGTSALQNFWEANFDTAPDLLIVDEQQKSSRDQRERIIGENTNFLEATATCLPRTMGLVEHGALSLSILRTQPVKKNIKSAIITPESKRDVFKRIHGVLNGGGRCAIVLPEVDAKIAGDAESEKRAVATAVAIWDKIFPGKVIGLHGRMKESEKIASLEKVKRGDFPIVLATSLIEIGITIPDLRLLLVIHPERLGVSQLHQLRGRLVRNGGSGLFYLLVEGEQSPKTMSRLKTVCSLNDGFELAVADFERRGFGDLAEDSTEQSGDPVCLFRNLRVRHGDVERVTTHLGVVGG